MARSEKSFFFLFFFAMQCRENLIIKKDNLSLAVTTHWGYSVLLNIHDFTERIMLRKRQKVNGYFQLSVQLGEKEILCQCSYLQQLAPNPQKRLEGHVCLLRFRWKTCWRNRLLRRWSCRSASGHQVEFHVPSSTTPNKRFQSEPRLGQHGQRYTHAARQNLEKVDVKGANSAVKSKQKW